MTVLITIPARNEELSIGDVVSACIAEARRLDLDFMIHVVDDGSTDGTAQAAERAGARVFSIAGGEGLASVFRVEMAAALRTHAELVVHLDADGQYSPLDLSGFLEALASGADLVLGNRLHRPPDGMSEIRLRGNRLLSELVTAVCGTHISDSQTGFRAFRRAVAECCRVSASFTYTQEQIIRATHAGYVVREIPIHFGRRMQGRSRLFSSPFIYLSRVALDIDHVVRELALDPERMTFASNPDERGLLGD